MSAAGGRARSSVADVGRHTEPGTGAPTPDRGFWVRAGIVGVAVVLLGGYLLTRGGDDVTTATPKTSPSASQPTTPTTPTAATTSTTTTSSAPDGSPSPTPSDTAPSSSTDRSPTLAFRVLRPSYITVRVPGGETLVSKVFRKGQQRSFDRPVLQVVNGRPSAVRFTVNGTPREPGPAEVPERFTVRRR